MLFRILLLQRVLLSNSSFARGIGTYERQESPQEMVADSCLSAELRGRRRRSKHPQPSSTRARSRHQIFRRLKVAKTRSGTKRSSLILTCRRRLDGYLALWARSPPGRHTPQNCATQALPKTVSRVFVYIYIYIYICRERERDIEREICDVFHLYTSNNIWHRLNGYLA